MNLFPLHKGLMWKEWRQNRWVFWLGLLILCAPLIWNSLLGILDCWIDPIEAPFQEQRWRSVIDVGYSVLLYHNVFFPMAALAATTLGAFLLSQERTVANTLDFLVATPVSRREIIAAKFVTGLKMIGIVLAVNLVFVLLVDAVFQASTSAWWVIKFFCEQLVFLVAIYSVGFLLAVVCGNLLSTAVAAIVINFGPIFVINFLKSLSNHYFVTGGNEEYYRMLNRVSMALTLFHYPTLRADQVNLVQVICLFVVALICYWLTLVLFERNEMERNGRLLMFGDVWKLAQVIVPFFFALFYGFENEYGIDEPQAWIKFIITFVILFVLIKLARRVMRNFGFR